MISPSSILGYMLSPLILMQIVSPASPGSLQTWGFSPPSYRLIAFFEELHFSASSRIEYLRLSDLLDSFVIFTSGSLRTIWFSYNYRQNGSKMQSAKFIKVCSYICSYLSSNPVCKHKWLVYNSAVHKSIQKNVSLCRQRCCIYKRRAETFVGNMSLRYCRRGGNPICKQIYPFPT